MGAITDISAVLLELGLSSSATDEERAIASGAIRRAESSVKRHLRYDPVQRKRTEYYPQSSFYHRGVPGVWESTGEVAFVRRTTEASTSELQVQHIPIRSVTTLHIDYNARAGTRDGAFGAETLKEEGVNFWPNYDGVDGDGDGICRDGIIRSEGLWPDTPGSVKLVYVAGYSAAEFHGEESVVDAVSIAEVVVDEAVRRVRKAFIWKKNQGVGFHLPYTSEKLGDYAYTIDSSMTKSLFGGVNNLTSESRQKLETFVNIGYDLGS